MSWLSDLFHRLFPPRPAPGPGPDPPPVPTPAPGPATIMNLLALHNRARAGVGSGPLVLSAALGATAQRHADWMAAHNDLDHFEPGADPFQRIRAAGYPSGSENIAEGQRSAAEAVGDWLSDRPHAQNVLSPRWTDVGFGVAYSRQAVAFWCADYGTKRVAGVAGEEPALPGGVRRRGDWLEIPRDVP